MSQTSSPRSNLCFLPPVELVWTSSLFRFLSLFFLSFCFFPRKTARELCCTRPGHLTMIDYDYDFNSYNDNYITITILTFYQRKNTYHASFEIIVQIRTKCDISKPLFLFLNNGISTIFMSTSRAGRRIFLNFKSFLRLKSLGFSKKKRKRREEKRREEKREEGKTWRNSKGPPEGCSSLASILEAKETKNLISKQDLGRACACEGGRGEGLLRRCVCSTEQRSPGKKRKIGYTPKGRVPQ